MSHIASQVDGSVLILKFDRPDKKNAITYEMYQTLADQLNQAGKDPAIRTVVIGSTSATFTAGNDINDFANNPIVGEESPVFNFLFALHNFTKPLIAAVSGRAVGIGTTMMFHCDLAVANPKAIFSMPFVSLGLVPEAGSSYLFPKLVGHVKASEIFLTGRDIDAREALELGIINQVAEDEFSASLKFAQEIADQPPTAVQNTKALLKSANHEALNQVMRAEGKLFAMAMQSEEAQEAFMKFLSKRSK